jgi:hypothetical protein
MTAKELCDNLGAAKLAQFGPGDEPAEVFPSLYFNYGVFSIDPQGGKTQRAPKYCATNLGATELSNLLGPSRIVLGNAMVFAGLGGSFSDTEAVPWIIVIDGTKESTPINAGVLLDYFNHASYPCTQMEADQALGKAQFEVKGAFGS